MTYPAGTGPFGLHTIEECAKHLKVGVSNLRDWKRSGAVSTKMVGGRAWWPADAIDDQLREHLELPPAPLEQHPGATQELGPFTLENGKLMTITITWEGHQIQVDEVDAATTTDDAPLDGAEEGSH